MKRIFGGAGTLALIVVAAFGLVSMAQAVPIEFTFSGTYQPTGERATGTFLLESDAMVKLGPFGPQTTYTDLHGLLDRPVPMLSSFTLGDTSYSLSDYLPGGYGDINYVDVCTPDCGPYVRENWGIASYQQDYPYGASPAPTISSSRTLWFDSGTPFDLDHTQSFDFFDASTRRRSGPTRFSRCHSCN